MTQEQFNELRDANPSPEAQAQFEARELVDYSPQLVRLRKENAALRAALNSQIEWWKQVPSGIDYDADESNASPYDSVAHIAGLAVREARAALGAKP